MKNANKYLALITARGGSKGLKRKNVLPLGGKPLIEWTIDEALKSQRLSSVLVSTDDDEIAHISKGAGARVPFVRPDSLSDDISSHVEVVLHAIQWLEDNEGETYDYVVLLQPTVPFRMASDIDEAIELIEERAASSLVGVCESEYNPMLLKNVSDDLVLSNYYNETIEKDMRRQEMEQVWRVNGAMYICAVAHMKLEKSWYAYNSVAYKMPASRSIDIDTQMDFEYAEYLVSKRC